MLTCIHLQKCYTSKYYAPLCHNRSGTLTPMLMLNMTTSPMCCSESRVPWPVRLPQEPPFFDGQTVSVLNDTRNLWLLPASSAKLIMVHTWSKSLVVDSTDMLVTTIKNVIQMLQTRYITNINSERCSPWICWANCMSLGNNTNAFHMNGT